MPDNWLIAAKCPAFFSFISLLFRIVFRRSCFIFQKSCVGVSKSCVAFRRPCVGARRSCTFFLELCVGAHGLCAGTRRIGIVVQISRNLLPITCEEGRGKSRNAACTRNYTAYTRKYAACTRNYTAYTRNNTAYTRDYNTRFWR